MIGARAISERLSQLRRVSRLAHEQPIEPFGGTNLERVPPVTDAGDRPRDASRHRTRPRVRTPGARGRRRSARRRTRAAAPSPPPSGPFHRRPRRLPHDRPRRGRSFLRRSIRLASRQVAVEELGPYLDGGHRFERPSFDRPHERPRPFPLLAGPVVLVGRDQARTARAEPAARGRIDRTRDFTLEHAARTVFPRGTGIDSSNARV